MFKRRTLFIVGAGASSEATLPVGSQLASLISDKLDIRFQEGHRHVGHGDLELYRDLCRGRQHSAQLIQQACWLIRDGIHLANSIDDFLDLHQENQELTLVGKAAVAKSILEAERKSTLYYNWRKPREGINFPNLAPTWFNKFMKMASQGVPRRRVESIFENPSFVVFNYDRCIEHYLLHALQRLYGMSEPEVAPICASVRIVHPYGVLAPLATETSRNGVRYGEPDDADVPSLTANIKTYTERKEEGEELAQIRTEVEKADCLVFLGFAFHEQGMRLISPGQRMKPKAVYATAFGMSGEKTEVSRNQIYRMFTVARKAVVHITNEYTCAKLLDNYSKSFC
jgi:hypothetical protein